MGGDAKVGKTVKLNKSPSPPKAIKRAEHGNASQEQRTAGPSITICDLFGTTLPCIKLEEAFHHRCF